MANVKWEKGSRFKVQGSRPDNQHALVALGDKFAMSSGLLEISYDSGAKVILQGPAVYKVESAAGGFLSIGKLTARVEKREGGREERGPDSNPQPDPSPLSTLHSPLFTIHTPTATVTDLGTEFGVEVDKSGATHSYVFQGRIEVVAVNGDSRRKPVQLRENESVVIDGSGEILASKQVDKSRFARRAEFNPFPDLINLAEGKLTFQETFHRDAAAFPAGYPTWFYNPHAVGGSDNTAATAIIRNGVLRLTREKTEIRVSGTVPVDTEIASIARQFSGKMLVSVDLGCDSSNYGNSHIALRLGDVIIAFHPGHYGRDKDSPLRGAFRVDGLVMNTDMGFVPDVDVLHHLYVYYDGKDAFQVCLFDGLYSNNVFRTSFTTPLLNGKNFTIGIHRSGWESAGMFDNLRVIELAEKQAPANPVNGGSGK